MKNSLLVILLMATFTQSFSQTDTDPYLWLEEVESEKSMEWVHAQNALSSERLTAVKGFDELKGQFLNSLNDQDKIDYPSLVGDMVYNFWKDENHVRGIWRRTTKDAYMSKNATWETIIDLDELSKKDDAKWVFHGATWLAPNYEVCLLALSDGGTDEDIVREFNVRTKEFVKNGFELPSSKGSIGWINSDEIIMSRNFGEGTLTSSGYPRIVKTLRRGQAFDEAHTIMEGEKDIMGIWASSEYIDGKYEASIYKAQGFYEHTIYALKGKEIIELDLPNNADVSGKFKDQFLVTLNSDWEVDGQKFKQGDLLSLHYPGLLEGKYRAHLVYHPNEKSSIDGVSITKNAILVNVIENVTGALYETVFKDGKWTMTKAKTPEFGSLYVVEANRTEEGYFYIYSDFITPSTLYYKEGQDIKTIRQGKSKFKSDNLLVNQYFIKSKDGTQIPYFIVHDKDIKLNSKNPTLVYAYGGFNVSEKPYYNTNMGIGWLEKGGVYVVANIRGGGEFGPAWHQAAKKEKRQNAYDDFYAVCEDLIDRKVTSPKHLGAFGWSNGGLMAGAVATQRPELFNAVIIGAPLLDMRRYNKMLAGASWMGEYGNPDIPEEWEYISKYSPYHNLDPETDYPEVFLITSTKDDRVHPAHARKMAARMMEQGHPLFYYETVEGGHGASSTNEQSAFNSAMMFSYLALKLIN